MLLDGDHIPLHTVRFLERFLIGRKVRYTLPTTHQPKADVETAGNDQPELQIATSLGIAALTISSESVDESKNNSGFSFRPSRESGIFNAYRAKDGDYCGQGPRYKNAELEYTQVWDAEAKCYVTNVSLRSTLWKSSVF